MGFLSKLLNKISELPLIGPHDGYEAELLLAGVKPIGLCVDVFPPEGVHQEETEIMSGIRNDILKLNIAVENGQLIKESFISFDKFGARNEWNIYGQNSQKLNVERLCNILKSDQGLIEDEPKGLACEGNYFGYRKQDIRLFSRGGYSSLNPISNAFLRATHTKRHRHFNQRLLSLMDDTPKYEEVLASTAASLTSDLP